MDCESEGVEIVQYLAGGIGVVWRRFARTGLVAAGDVAAHVGIGPVLDEQSNQIVTTLL